MALIINVLQNTPDPVGGGAEHIPMLLRSEPPTGSGVYRIPVGTRRDGLLHTELVDAAVGVGLARTEGC